MEDGSPTRVDFSSRKIGVLCELEKLDRDLESVPALPEAGKVFAVGINLDG